MMTKTVLEPTTDLVVNRGAKYPQLTDAAPVKLSLVFGAAIIAVVVAIALGLAAAVMRGGSSTLLMILG